LPDGELDRLVHLARNGPPDIAETARRHLQQAPQIETAYAFYWNAWHDLGTERAGGMGVSPIPQSAIWHYCERYELTAMERDAFEHVVRAVDGHFMTLRAEQQRKQTK
jgi:hypothetical protein